MYKSQTTEQNDTVSHHSCSFCLFVCFFILIYLFSVFWYVPQGRIHDFFQRRGCKYKSSGKPWTNPFEQISANFAFFLNRSFYSLKGFVFYLEYYRILFLGLFCIKKKEKTLINLSYLTKPMEIFSSFVFMKNRPRKSILKHCR